MGALFLSRTKTRLLVSRKAAFDASFMDGGVVGGDIVRLPIRSSLTKKVREILKTELNAKNTAKAIRTYAMPVMRYEFRTLR